MSYELEFLINVVKEASNLITDEFEVKAKDSKGDLVTNFDYEIEKTEIYFRKVDDISQGDVDAVCIKSLHK